MTPKERAAMQQALEALVEADKYYDYDAIIAALREALAEQATVSGGLCGGCSKKAADGWALYCVECWEKAEQPVSQEYQDHLVNQSFDWAAMAAKHQFMEGYQIGLAEMREKCAKVVESGVLGHGECAAAIRAINFEGDTGFRPVSEMIAEHKQDPKKAAAIEKAKMRKASRAEKIAMPSVYEVPVEQAEPEPLMDYERINALREGEQNGAEDAYFFVRPENDTPTLRKMFCQGFERGFHKGLKYAAPVRTKDLTVSELDAIIEKHYDDEMDLKTMILDGIAAYKEKNK